MVEEIYQKSKTLNLHFNFLTSTTNLTQIGTTTQPYKTL